MKKIFVKMLSLLLCGTMLLSMAPITLFAEEGGENIMYITELKVNNLVEPIGIDTVPSFRWLNNMSGYARSQSAYQIIVASTAEKAAAHDGDVWDSGKVESNLNYDIVYGGDALASCTEYYFAVQVWDEDGNSVWSDVSKFGTGFFDDAEWSAKWIGMTDGDSVPCDITLSGANWIWFKDGAATTGAGTEYFRKHFTVDENKEVDEVLVVTTMDDYGYLFVNCSNVLSVENVRDEWKTGKVVNITPFVEKGENIFAARVINGSSSAGFIAKIEVRYTDGSVDTTVTDTTWKVSNTATSTSGWERPGFNDTKWDTPDMSIKYGSGPWGTKVVMPETIKVNVGAGAPMLRKTFELTKEVKDAKLYISGLGTYKLFVNGNLPDDSVLNIAHTEYEDTVHYRAYDVTDMLSSGKNALAVELGNYFYNCDFYTWIQHNAAVYRDNPKLLLELRIDYADGTSETVVSDESWKTYEYGPTTYNNVYKGEHYDTRREVDGWNTASFDDSTWKNAVSAAAPTGDLVFENMDPIRRIETFVPEVFDKGSGTYIIKNPVMATGWANIAFEAPRGTEITITYGEKLDDMGFLVAPLYGCPLQVDKFITSGGKDIYEPSYTYKGYNYIQIDNYPGTLTAEDVECYLIANDVDVISTFETGDSRINSLTEIMYRTIDGNMQSVLTDTPVYEKNGWLDSFNLGMDAFNFHYDFANMLQKVHSDMIDGAVDGVVRLIAPSGVNGGGKGTPVWTAGLINGNYENWRVNGITTGFTQTYDDMRLLAQYYIETVSGNGWVWTDGGYGDWLSPNDTQVYTTGKTTHAPEGAAIVQTAFVYRSLGEIAEMAEYLGKTDDAAEYRAAMESIYTAFNEEFYDEELGYYDTGYWNETYGGGRTKYRQTSNIMPLMFGLCPAEYEQGVVENVVNDVIAKDYHLDTGSSGTKYILPMLSKYGYGDIAMTIVHQDTYPSWGYWINNGATTLWETYELNSRSRSHFFLGTYVDWFYKNLAGVRDAANGYETVELRPEIIEQVGYVNYSLKTVRGTLKSYWRFTEDNKLVWDVTIPVGTTATVYVPTETEPRTLNSGSYSFTVDASEFDVDKSLLEAAVADAKTFNEVDYTVTSWNALCDVISVCETVLADENATQYAVCEATNALEEAVASLTENGSRKALEKLIASVETIGEDGVPATVLAQLTETLETAKTAISNNDASVYEDAYTALNAAMYEAAPYGKGNLALGKEVAASSSVESAAWGKQKLTDGDRENLRGTSEVCGWSSNSNGQHNHTEYVIIDLGAVYKINQVQVMPAGATKGNEYTSFPEDFTILVSIDGEKWTSVYSAENYPIPTTTMQVFNFDAENARYVRFEGTSIRPKTTDGNTYRMQLAEIEVYNTSVGDTTTKIGTAEEFMALMNGTANLSGDYKLTADIDLTGLAQKPISGFTGTFDGDGHTISGINITGTANDVGLFGVVGGTATDPVVIKNLTISGQINGATFSAIGGLVGKVTGCLEIDNVTNKCIVSTSGDQVGGIIGFVSVASGACANISIANTVNDAEINGDQYVGGLVGHVDYNAAALSSTFSISKSANYKNVTSNTNTQIGGIVGYYCFRADNVTSSFTELYNTGDVSGTKYVGGIIGYTNIPVADKITVENVLNTGDLTATSGVLGGIMGGAINNAGGKDIIFRNVYSSGTVTGTGSATFEGVHIGAWRYISADGNLFYLDNGNANLNTNGSPIAVTAETVLVKDTFASLLEDSAWIYVNGNGPELKAFHTHTEMIIPSVEPTYTSSGLTEGKKCSGCDEILVAQEEIPKLTLKGDMDGNGIVSVADVLVLIKAVVNYTSPENGDINGDGMVSLIDAIRVMKIAAGVDVGDKEEKEVITVACVGDSITYGTCSTDATKYSYPARLKELLGDGYEVVNCGEPGSYVMRVDSPYNTKSSIPERWYPNTAEYTKLMNCEPDIIIVMLGTNDARSMSAPAAIDDFVSAYKDLIADFKTIESNPKIYLSSMLPITTGEIVNQGSVNILPGVIEGIAEELGLDFIPTHETLHDYFSVMLDYSDKIHPNDDTYPALAVNFYNEVFGNDMELPTLPKAQGDVVYVSDAGTFANDGTSPENAVDNLGLAVAMLRETGGTVVVSGELTVGETFLVECADNVTVTSVYGGVDYRATNGAKLLLSGGITLASELTFENLSLEASGSGKAIKCNYNSFTVAEGVACTGDITINGGYSIAASALDAETVSCHKDCTISVASGTWYLVRGGNCRSSGGVMPVGTVDEGVTLTVNISGGTFTYSGVNTNAAVGMNGCDGDVYFNISGGTFKGGIYGIHRTGSNTTGIPARFNGNIYMNITGGTFEKGVGLYHTADTPKVQGEAVITVKKNLESSVTLDGFTITNIVE